VLPSLSWRFGAIDRNLVVSELFGYKKGAFTGAQSDRRGYVHAAAGGTLFLDEIDEADGRTQALVLRQNRIGACFHQIMLLAVHTGDGARQLQKSESPYPLPAAVLVAYLARLCQLISAFSCDGNTRSSCARCAANVVR
jgi:Sigma-54 interaction domain